MTDAAAIDIFQKQWDLYGKFLLHDYLNSAGAYAALRKFLDQEMPRPFTFADFACGDASGIVGALEGTAVAGYRGIDLSEPALALADRNLSALQCPVQLDEMDFRDAAGQRSDVSTDIAWIGLSLHHVDAVAKLAFMRDVRQMISNDGAFLIYEPMRLDDETRADYFDRFERVGKKDWTELTPDEFDEAMNHVRTCDMPETVSTWKGLGADAGFSACVELFCSDRDLFRLNLYRP